MTVVETLKCEVRFVDKTEWNPQPKSEPPLTRERLRAQWERAAKQTKFFGNYWCVNRELYERLFGVYRDAK